MVLFCCGSLFIAHICHSCFFLNKEKQHSFGAQSPSFHHMQLRAENDLWDGSYVTFHTAIMTRVWTMSCWWWMSCFYFLPASLQFAQRLSRVYLKGFSGKQSGGKKLLNGGKWEYLVCIFRWPLKDCNFRHYELGFIFLWERESML